MDHQTPSNNKNKVKLLCKYGGEILLKPHANNSLAYVGGTSKIIAVDRNIKLSALKSILNSFCKTKVRITYQFPGEDLDTLITVINDEDLENMMCEYDHASRSSSWLRLLLFPNPDQDPEPICSTSVEVEASSQPPQAKTHDYPPDPAPLIPDKVKDKPLLLDIEDHNQNHELERLAVDNSERLAALVTDYQHPNIPETSALLLPLHDQAQAQSHVVSGGYSVPTLTEFPAGGFIRAAPILSGTLLQVQGMMMSNGQSQTYYIPVVPIQPEQVYNAAAPTRAYHNSAILRFGN